MRDTVPDSWFAAQTLPKLQQHLQMAQRLAGWNEAMPASATEHGTGTHGATSGDRTGTGTSGDRDRTSTPGSSGTDRERGSSTPGTR